MSKIRIFVLGKWIVANLLELQLRENRDDLEIETVNEEDLGFLQVNDYDSSPEICGAIEDRFATEQFDLVVVCNNLGAGVSKAPLIPEKLRGRTIVLWNYYHPGREKPYTDLGLGLHRFTSLEDIGKDVAKLLAEESILAS